MKFIVMAGGQGTKLWPMSTKKLPKQFQPIVGDKTLYQNNIDTLLKAYSPQDIYVSTNGVYESYAREQAPLIPAENFIIEPNIKRDTGPAAGLALTKVALEYPDEPIMFYVQPVVIRDPEEKYLQFIKTVESLIIKENKLVSGGMRPFYPDVGSDYFKLGEKIASVKNSDAYLVDEFVHRTGDLQKTKDLIENFYVSTHCNHYSWYAGEMLNAYKEIRPDWYECLMQIQEAWGKPNQDELIEKYYAKMDAGRIEQVTEHLFNSHKAIIALLPFKWVHVSTWSDVYEYLVKGDGDNYVDANSVSLKTSNSLIKSTTGKFIATFGLDNVIVVETDQSILICDKAKVGNLGDLLTEIENQGKGDLL